jgi:signal transduction histidine kinase
LLVREGEKRRSRRRFIELEREQSLERERSRIAHDLHDDLGASLTEIGLLGAVAQRPAVTPERARHYLGEITEKARMMVDTLDEIVWAINPRNDTVTSLGNYFCEYAQRMLQLTSIRCRLDLADSLPAHALDPERRHHLFLAFSEALNNVVRHSGATEVLIRIAGDPGALRVSVEDNGRGLPAELHAEGAEGLRSMKRRLERMGGCCKIEGRDGCGTKVRFIVPLE